MMHRAPNIHGFAIAGLLSAAVAIYLAADERTQFLLGNTALLIARTLAIAMPIGAALALLIAKTDLPARRAFFAVLVALLFLPIYVHASAWESGQSVWRFFGRFSGWSPPRLEGSWGAAWVHAMASVGWIAVIGTLGLRQVERELEEEALLFANRATVFLRVTLRRSASTFLAAALWVAATTSAEMTVTDLFQVRTFAEEIYTGLQMGDWTTGEPLSTATGAALTALFATAAMIACWQLASSFPTRFVTPLCWRLRGGRWPAFVAAVGLLLLVAGLPLASLLAKAGIEVTQTEEGLAGKWSAARCATIVLQSPQEHRQEIFWSLVIAGTAASLAVACAAPLTWLARGGGRMAAPAIVVAAVALALPGPLLGLGVIRLLNRPELPLFVELYDRSILAPMLVQTVKALPLAILILGHAFSTIATASLDAAAIDGAGRWTQLMRIAIPARLPSVAGAWLAAMVVAWGELAATVLVLPPGISTLPVRVFGLLHYGVQDQVAGISLLIVAIVTIVALTLNWLMMRTSLTDREE